MERFVLERKIPVDIWREIKTYLVHNIITQGKHLKKERTVIKFNNTLQNLPRIKPTTTGPKIIYSSILKPYRLAKYVYHIQAFKPVDNTYRDGKLTIIVHIIYLR